MRDTLLESVRNNNWDECERLLYEDWTQQSPEIFASNADAPWDSKPDESVINDVLLKPIASAFCLSETNGVDLHPLMSICGLSYNAFAKGSICGKVFRNGEVTYSCKECAVDSTCVFCYECFMRSVHRLHKYRVNTSGGTGYCDCGDLEAWKTNASCEMHADTSKADSEKEMQLPDDINSRIWSLTRFILRYSMTMICWSQSDELPNLIKQREMCSTPYQTILFNDETHTYDAVIRALNLSIQCNEQQAMLLATIVDHEGRTSVRSGSAEFCGKAKEEIQRRTQKDINRKTEKTGPLEVRIMDSRLVAVQNFSLRLLSWLTSQIRNFPPLGTVIGKILLTEKLEMFGHLLECDVNSLQDTIIVHVMKCDRALWKGARSNFHQMIMATVLMNSEQKQLFTRELVRHYQEIYLGFIDDDHDHSASITALSVQVFTAPTLARMLIAEEDALEVIMKVLIDFCRRYLREPEKKQFDFSTKTFPNVLRRALFMMDDFNYLLTTVPTDSEWTPSLLHRFRAGCLAFIQFLSYIQGMDEVKRQSGEHQAWEPEWETAFNIHLRIQSAITMVIAWITSNKALHADLFRFTLGTLCSIADHCDEFHNKVRVEVNGVSAMCVPFDVTQERISIHQSLWRFMAGLFAAPSEFIENAIVLMDKNYFNNCGLNGTRAILYEMPMRVLVLCAQCHAHMWRRNGFSLVNQIHNYFSRLCRLEMFDRDILMLQVGAAVSPPDVFLIRFLHRFGLCNWATFGYEEQKLNPHSSNTTQEELSKCTVVLAEEMLHYVICIIEERYLPGVGKSTRQDALRREVLHILATGPKPFSKIESEIPDSPLIPEVSLDDVAKEICDFRQVLNSFLTPTKTKAGVFVLKKSVWKEYSPFFYHYSKTHISQAEQYQRRQRAGSDNSVLACPPPKAPAFEPFFSSIRNLLLSPVLLRVLRLILERTARRNRYSSDGLLHRALYIIGLGLNEQVEDEKFDFINEAEKENLLKLMQNLEDKVEASLNADLLSYLIQRYQLVKIKLDGLVTVSKDEREAASDSVKKVRRSAMAAKMRKQAMDQMNRMQMHFVASNKSMLDEDAQKSTSAQVLEDDEPTGIVPVDSGFPVCVGINRLNVEVTQYRRLICILCQEGEIVKFDGKFLVCAGFLQRIFDGHPFRSSLFAQKSDMHESQELFLSSHLPVGMDVSTCGHTMHYECYQHYLELLRARERGRSRQTTISTQRHIDIESGEYLCPLCKRLSNIAIPLLPALSLLDVKRFDEYDGLVNDFNEWIVMLETALNAPSTSKSGRTHSRKRSHSERFAVGRGSLQNGANCVVDNNLSSSVPSVNALPLNAITENSSEAVEGGNRIDSDVLATSVTIGEEVVQFDSRIMPEHRLLAMLPFPNFVNKMKELMGHTKQCVENVPKSFLAWDVVRRFLREANLLTKRSETRTNIDAKAMEAVTIWQMTAFTLRSIAAVLRHENKALFGALNARQKECLFAITRISAVAAFNCRPQNIRALFRKLLSPMLGSSESIEISEPTQRPTVASEAETIDSSSSSVPFSPHSSSLPSSPVASSSTASSSTLFFISSGTTRSESAGSYPTPLLHSIDMLSAALELAMSVGWSWMDGKIVFQESEISELYLVPNGSQQEQYAIQLALIGHLFQILATFDRGDPSPILKYPTTLSETDDRFNCVITKLLHIVRGENFVFDINLVRQAVFVGIVEFLRPLALFYHALTLVPPPEALKGPSYDEFQPLCRYLGLPSDIVALLSMGGVEDLFNLWSSRRSRAFVGKGENVAVLQDIFVRQPVIENSLIELPEDFSELMNTAANFRCPNSFLEDHISTMPTLCLLCGTLLCSQSYCCQKVSNKGTKGACSYHLQTCSGPSGGIFLRIRDCHVILLTTSFRGCFLPAPYVDEFGETDFGFRRGNPLVLNKELYARLQQIWLHQTINEEVVNQNENDNRNRYEWQHF